MPPVPSQQGRPAWLHARIRQVVDTWTAAGFPPSALALRADRAVVAQLEVDPINVSGFWPVVAGVSLVLLADRGPTLGDFELLAAVGTSWPGPLQAIAAQSVSGIAFCEPVPLSVAETCWALVLDGMEPDLAREVARRLA